jgi:hypothetical protein
MNPDFVLKNTGNPGYIVSERQAMDRAKLKRQVAVAALVCDVTLASASISCIWVLDSRNQ